MVTSSVVLPVCMSDRLRRGCVNGKCGAAIHPLDRLSQFKCPAKCVGFDCTFRSTNLTHLVGVLAVKILRGRTLSVPSQPVSLGHDVLGAFKYWKDVILYGATVEVVWHKSLLLTAKRK